MILSVRHLTTYSYRKPVAFGEHRIIFRPRDSYDQRLIEAKLAVEPAPVELHWMHDVFGNCVTVAQFGMPAAELRFESAITLDHCPSQAPEFRLERSADTYPFSYDAQEQLDLAPWIERQYADPEGVVDRWARGFLSYGRSTPTGELLKTLTSAIKDGFEYERRAESGTHPPLVTLERRRGSCRDLALLMMEAVRSLGLAARFVSGYIYIPDRDEAVYVGGGSTHAWCQVYLPGAGWVEFDPTNGIVGNRDLIRVAVARAPSQAVPLTGTYFGSPDDELGMTVEVQVSTRPASPGDPRGIEPA